MNRPAKRTPRHDQQRQHRRRGLISVVVAVACAAQLLIGMTRAQAATTPAGWSLSWSDEFDTGAGTRPNSTKWGYDLGGSGFGNAERQYYTDRPENVSTNGSGSLAITARKETLAGTGCWYGTCQYTSGRVLTKNKFTQRYGRFESRIKVPAGQGVWPAFWMQGDDSGSGGTAWPGRGELDIMENVGFEPSKVHGSLHGPGYSGGAAVTKGYTLPGGAKFSDAFHTFAVEWAPNVVRWYVDDVLYQTRTPADLPAGAPWVVDHPFYILMNFAVGGQWPGDPSPSTVFPQSMLVDYVRVFTPSSTTSTTTAPTTTVAPTTTTAPPAANRDARSRIEAESYDTATGVSREATTDTGGGQNIGWVANGDSVTYRNVNFGSTGIDGVTARVASGAAGATGTAELHLDSATGPLVGTLPLGPTGGWQTWVTKAAAVAGATGTRDLVVVFRSAQAAEFVNLNWLTFTGSGGSTVPSTTTTVVPTTTTVPPSTTTTVPAAAGRDARTRIEAESYDTATGVVTESTADTGGGQNVGWISNRDHMVYRGVNFGSGGVTGVTSRVASGAAPGVSGAVEFRLGSATGPKVGEFSLANTGGWQSWRSVPTNVAGANGVHDLYVVARSGQPADFVNFNWLTFTGSGGTTTSVPPVTTTTVPPVTTTTTVPAPTGSFPFVFANNTGGRWANSQIYVTVLGQSSPGQWSYLKADGTTAPINHLEASAPGHLTKNGRNYPNMSFRVDQAPSVRLASRFEGARMYLSLGSPLFIPVSPDDKGWGGPNVNDPGDPNTDVYFDWYEFTYRDGVYSFGGNTTQVDQFGFPMTARIEQTSSGYDQTVGITATRAEVYAKYAASVDPSYTGLASPYRILAPRTSPAFHGTGAQANVLKSVIDQTWAHYATNPFTLTRLGQTFTGKVVGTQLQFTKDGTGPYVLNKPTSADVFECSGALASGGMKPVELEMGAEFCAAFNRGVSMNTADWYRPAAYYQGGAGNDFSAVFHAVGLGGRAYGFAYDDVNDQSSVKILPNSKSPTRVTIGIGW